MKARVSKKFLPLFLALCMVLAMLPSTAFAEAGAVDSGTSLEDSGTPPSLVINVSGTMATGATLQFTADQDGTVYYLVQEASEDAPDMDTLKNSSSVEVTAGTPAAIEVEDLLAGTDYTVYGVAATERELPGGDPAAGSDIRIELVSSIVSSQFTLAAPAAGKRDTLKAGALLMGSAPGTHMLNAAWKTDSANGFSEPTASVGASGIYYEPDCIYLFSNATTGEWIEFAASPGEGLDSFDLTSFTLGKYLVPSISFDFTITGTKIGGATVSEHFTWPSGSDATKTFSGSQFANFTQLTKFSIILQNVSTQTYDIEFREFTITNPVGSGNTPPIISDLTDITFPENEVNAAFRQIDSDIAVTDADSADFDGGQVAISYTGAPLAEDQLSIGNIGNISLSGNAVNYTGIGQIGAVSGGVNGSPLTIALTANATPARVGELLRAITYKNISNDPTSHRIISVTVSDGDGGISAPATAKISVSGQAESGVEYPSLLQDTGTDWVNNLNNGFSVQGNGGVLVGSDSTSIWVQNNTESVTASIHIAAAEQFAGGMFDLSGLTFDIIGSGNTYKVEIIGYKPNASTVTAAITGDSKAVLAAIDLSSMTGIVAFDFRVTASTAANVTCVGIDTFTIANPAEAGGINTAPVIAGFNAITFLENEVNAGFQQIDTDVTVTDADSTDFDGGQVTVAYTGVPLAEDQLSIGNIGSISLSGNTVQYSGTAIGIMSGGVNGASLVVALNSDATPGRTSELLRAITYKNISNDPASHRTVSVTVSDGDGGISSPATAKISVSGQAESGVEYPSLLQNIGTDWVNNLNNGFSVRGNGLATVGSDSTSIWVEGRTAATASLRIAADEQFAGGMFNLSGLTFDVVGTGKTYTVTIIGHRPGGGNVTAVITGDSKAALAAIDLSSMAGLVSFDFQVTAPTAVDVECVGLDSFTISDLGTANAPPSVSGLPTSVTVMEDIVANVDLSATTFSDSDGDSLTVTLTATAGIFTGVSDGGVTVGGSGTGTLTLAGTATAINTYLNTAANIRYTGALNANGTGAATIAVNVNDGTVNPLVGTISVNITAVNDAPTITGLPAAITVAEHTASNIDLSAVSFADVDAGGDYVTLILSVDQGTLMGEPVGGISIYEAGGILTLNGAAASIDAYLNTASNIKYTGPVGLSGNGAAILTLTANDGGHTGAGGGGNVTLGTVSLHITETAPTVTVVTSAKANGVYGIGSVIDISAAFTKPVVVTGMPQLRLNFGGGMADYASGSGTNTLTFTYTVKTGDFCTDLDYFSDTALTLSEGTIKTMSGIDAVLTLPVPSAPGSLGYQKDIAIDGIAPVVSSVTVPMTGTYSAGSALDFIVIFNDTVTVATGGGTPSLAITIGSTVHQAAYLDKTDPSGLRFRYIVQPGDLDMDGIAPGATLSLNGGAISDATGNPVVLTLNAVGSTSGVLADGVVPTLVSAARTDDTHITVSLSKPCGDLTKPNNGGFTVTQTGTSTSFAVSATSAGAGNTVVLQVANMSAADATGVTVTYTKGGNGTIADAAGNGLETDSIGVTVAAWIVVPSAPTGVTATAGSRQATVSFIPPTSDGGAEIIYYTVTASPGGITATGSASPITVTGLTNGIAYTFTAAATNSAGTGLSSAASNSVTPQAPSTGGGSTSSRTTLKYEASVSGSGGSVKVEVKVNAGSASADLTSAQAAKGEDIDVTMPKVSGVTNYTLSIPVSSLSDTIGNGTVTLNTGAGNATLPSDMLAGTDAASGSKVQVSIGTVRLSDLPKDAQDKVGNHPIVSLSLSVDGKTTAWNNPAAPVTVSIPYTPTAEELKNSGGITVWYIDGSGNMTEMKDAKYDPAAGSVVFTTTHFSYYAVGYKASVSPVKFGDVLPGTWYYDAVRFITEKGVTTGIGNGKFGPNASLTRGQFIVMLMRAYGIEPDANPTDNFSDAGNTYYTGYLAAAKQLGISTGVGANNFAPEKAVTRQELFTLLYNALKLLNKLPSTDTGRALADFTDSGNAASWATEAMDSLIKSGTITGADNKLDPTGSSTRAQMAQVLYHLLEK